MRRGASTQHGFALVLVLWIGLLMAAIGASLLGEARSASILAATHANELQAALLADAGIDRAILSLIDPGDSLRWNLDGIPQKLQFLDHELMVHVESENGKIDLNAAPQNLLSALFRSANISASDSQTLAERVAAWRNRVPHGAIDRTVSIYRDAGRSYGPRHAPFRSTGELRLVLGITDEAQLSIASSVTVYSGTATIDRGVASDNVLRVLQSAGDGFAAAQLSARAEGNAAGGDRLPVGGEVLSICATGESHGVVVERVAVVRLRGDASSPYTVLEWH